MVPNLISWWKKDTARNTFIYTNFIIGLAGSIAGTYITYQLQVVGFSIGTDAKGQPCTTYCIVPWGSSQLDLNAILLYGSAMQFGLGGFVTIFVVAYADYWKQKSLLVPIFMVIYGALGIPVYWLAEPTLENFNALFAILVAFGIVTAVFLALANIYIPYCMRAVSDASEDESPMTRSRSYGFIMSAGGIVSSNLSGCIVLAIVAILSATLNDQARQSAGLLVATIIGCLTVVAAIGSYLGLPVLPAKVWPANKPLASASLELITPFKKLVLAPNMLVLLTAYTIYTDADFALSSIITQLFYAQITPSTLEFTLFSLAGQAFTIVATFILLAVHSRWAFNLEKCLIIGYTMLLVVPVWGCIGIASEDDFGDKHRWEFYIQQLIISSSTAIVNVVFRILYAEFIPVGEEMMWYGLQIVVSCATSWIAYVATGPLQSATHNLRFPLILCLVFLLIPAGLEVTRIRLPVLRRGKLEIGGRRGEGEVPGEEVKEEHAVVAPKSEVV